MMLIFLLLEVYILSKEIVESSAIESVKDNL